MTFKELVKSYLREDKINEMAKSDLGNISPKMSDRKIVNTYIRNYKERTKKNISPQAKSAFKKTLEKDGRFDQDRIERLADMMRKSSKDLYTKNKK